MANPLLPTSGTHELQERYANAIIAIKRKQLVVRSLFGRDFEGDPKAGAVKIPKRNTEVAVGAYNVQTGKALTFGATEYVQVLVDQDQAVNELIDNYEAAAVPDNVVAQRLDSAGYSLGLTQEMYAIGVLQATTTAESSTAKLTVNDAYTSIVATIKELKKLGITPDMMRIVISPETEATLLGDVKYANTASQIGAELARDGVINKIAGVNVYMSPNLLYEGDVAGDDQVEYIVFSPLWAQTVEDWKVLPAINDLKDGVHIGASALQGRIVYKDTLLDVLTCRKKVYTVPSE
ncbi:MAG: hypothetical protein WC143_07590 [Eubacteriales bacterium]|jgi:hypothetical protein